MKITIVALGTEKTVNYTSKKTGKPDSFKKIGLQSQEYGSQWLDFTFRGEHGLSVGQTLDLDVTPREYNGKTYYDARRPKGTSQASINLQEVHAKLDEILAILKK